MKAYEDPIDRLKESLRWFIAVKELRLLHVLTSEDLWLPCLKQIDDSQESPHHRSLMVFIGTPVQEQDLGWLDRIGDFEDNYAALQGDAAAEEPPVALPNLPYRSGATALEQFAARLRACTESSPAPLEGLIVVLAPALIANSAAWVTDLRLLIHSPALDRVRWIIQESGDGPSRSLAAELGPRAEQVQILVGDDSSRATLRALVAGMKTAPAASGGERLAGMAGPRVAPPVRIKAPPADPEAQRAALVAAGIHPAFGDQAMMHQLRIAVLEAALAFREGRVNDAALSQGRARDLCVGAGLGKESALMELVLGAYALQAGAPDYALSVFDSGIQRAEKANAPLLQVQGHMARGGTLLSVQKTFEAAQAYTRAGELAEQNQLNVFAIESFRMVGQITLSQQQEQPAAAAWLRAIKIANKTPPDERAGSSAAVTARELAGVYRRAGLTAQERSLEEQAKQWEAEALAPPLPQPVAAEIQEAP